MEHSHTYSGASASPTVLVVEDDFFSRAMITEFLRDCGFAVLAAESADKALPMLRAHGEIDAVFSDVQMPGAMDGVDLAEWLAAERPDVKVLLTSGNNVREGGAGWPLLAKPYQLPNVESRLRAMM